MSKKNKSKNKNKNKNKNDRRTRRQRERAAQRARPWTPEAAGMVVPQIGRDVDGDALMDESEEAMQIFSMLAHATTLDATSWVMTDRFSAMLGEGLETRRDRLWDAAWMLSTMGREADIEYSDAFGVERAIALDPYDDNSEMVGVRVFAVPISGTWMLVLDLSDTRFITSLDDLWSFVSEEVAS